MLLVLPVRRLVNDLSIHDAMTLVPLYKLRQGTGPGTLLVVYLVVAALVALAFALLPRRSLRVMPGVLLVALVAASALAGKFVVDQAQAQQRRFLGNKPRWIDRKADGSVAYLYDGELSWNGVWETLLWNERVNLVYDLGDEEVPGPLPQAHATVQPDGTLFLPPSAPRPRKDAVASTWITLVGEKVKKVKQQDLMQAGLVLWRVEPPLRVSTWTTGLQVNGDISATNTARLAAYSCKRGTFRLTLIIKQPQMVEIRVNGRPRRRLTFPVPVPSWHGDFAVNGHGGECTLEVTPMGLTGTTVFEFDRD